MLLNESVVQHGQQHFIREHLKLWKLESNNLYSRWLCVGLQHHNLRVQSTSVCARPCILSNPPSHWDMSTPVYSQTLLLSYLWL